MTSQHRMLCIAHAAIHHLRRFSPRELTMQPTAALQLQLLEAVDLVFGALARAVAWGTGLGEVHRRGWLL